MDAPVAIVGHDRTLQHLRAACEADQLHHALLFEGPEGVGKHTAATWLARLANCTAAPEQRPCGTCGACTTIANGTHPDVITLGPDPDKATPVIPVERVREVVRTAGYHRFSARKRFVIVDPADTMQAAGANALLKTLEEPPPGTYFILVSGQASALLPTIVSRCQRVRFGPLSEEALRAWLEARGVDDAATIARVAHGAPGTALALAAGGLAERAELRQRLLGAIGGDLDGLFGFSEALTAGGRQQWTARVEAALALVEELLRDVVVRAAGDGPLLHADAEPVVDAWTAALWPSGVSRCHQALVEARRDLALNVSGKTAVDALLARMATELGSARTVRA